MKTKLFILLSLSAATTVAQPHRNDTIAMEEVVVTGVRYQGDARHLPMTVTTLSHETLSRNHRSSILPTLNEQVPGLFATSRGILGYGVSTGAAGNFTLRGVGGSSPNAGMLVLIDGVPQYAGLFGHAIADACQTMMAERVEVLRGPASILYGSNAMGGVINIVTRQMQEEGMKSSIRLSGGSYGTAQAEGSLRFRKGKFSSIAGLNYGRTDGHRKDNAFQQYTGFVKLGYDFHPHWSLTGDVDLTYFEASNPGEVHRPLTDNDQEITRGMASAALTHRHEHMTGALRGYFNWGHHRVNDGYHEGEMPQTAFYLHDDRMAGLSVYETFSFFPHQHITVGADWTLFGGKAWNEAMSDGSKSLLADKTQHEVAAYATLQQRIASWCSFHAGLRVDHHTQSGTELVPQGGLAFVLPHTIQLKAMVSKGFRNPTIKEMYMFPPQNPDLKPERVMNYEIGYRQTFLDERLRVGANLFYLTGENLIMTLRSQGRPQNVNILRMKNAGTEIETSFHISDAFDLNANYSFLHMKYPVIAAPEHKFYAGGRYRHRRFSVATGLQCISGLYTQTGEKEKTEDFILWDLTANYHLLPSLTLFAKGENLLAQRYEINHGFPMPRATFTGGIVWNW